ncbi:hypothetical protein [Pseudomonas rhodesiae]|uniref:hypothetical protein n=1 Tax=Pseudomonas rhodesiae TaxID=76760 RepID=UPI001F477CE0|nr:hypothetical protein [Pseudomonas rhodesiae]
MKHCWNSPAGAVRIVASIALACYAPHEPEDGAQGYQGFKEKTDQSLRAVFKP